MSKSTLFKVQALLLMVLLAGVLAACGATATPTPAPEPTATPEPAKPTEAPQATRTERPIASKLDLSGTTWAWQNTQMNDGTTTTPTNSDDYTLEFGVGGNVTVKADCNTGSGPYTVDGNKLTIGPVAMTMMACPDGSLDSTFLKNLDVVASYLKQGDNLILELKLDSGSMTFAPSTTSSGGLVPAIELRGKVWNWQNTQMNDGTTTTPTNPGDYTLDFKLGGTVDVKADCNTGSGPYTVDGNKLTIGPFAMTMMACPDGSLDSQFLKGLEAASSYFMQGDKLVIELKLDSGSMIFVPAGESMSTPGTGAATGAGTTATLTGTVWLWQQTLMNDDTKTTPTNPENYTIEFLPDGQYNLKADCNTGGGAYTLEGNNLTISPGRLTMMACPDGSLDSVFLKDLGNVGSYLIKDGNLILEIKMDSGTMTFAPASSGSTTGDTSADKLIGPTWKWQAPASTGGTPTPNPDTYTLEFLSSGKLNILADCNKAGGTYTADNGKLTIDAATMTRMACPEGSLSEAFVQQLNEATGYFMDGAYLYLTMKDSGMLKFSE